MFTWCCWYVCNAVLDLTDPSHSSVNGLLELSLWADLFTLIGYWFCVLWFDYCIFDRSKRNVLSRILTLSAILMQVCLGVQWAEPWQEEGSPGWKAESSPLCCLLSLCRAELCLYMDGGGSIYTHTFPIHHVHTHTHPRTQGCCSEHRSLLIHRAKFKPHSKLQKGSQWLLCCLD